MSLMSKPFKAWKLVTGRPGDALPEVFVKGSHINHVDPRDYYDKFGDARFVVHLTIVDITGETWYASAVAIASDILLTAGHTVLHDGNGSIDRAARVVARIGYHRKEPSNGQNMETREGTDVTVLHEWEMSGWDWRYDLAIIKLKTPFKDLIPASYSAPPLGRFDVSVLGFPSKYQERIGNMCVTGESGCMQRSKGSATANEIIGLIQYNITTASGNSGGPVVLLNNPKMVVATHSFGSKGIETNYAVPINVDFINMGTRVLRENILTLEPQIFSMVVSTPTRYRLTKANTSEKRRHYDIEASHLDPIIARRFPFRLPSLFLFRYKWHNTVPGKRMNTKSIFGMLFSMHICALSIVIAHECLAATGRYLSPLPTWLSLCQLTISSLMCLWTYQTLKQINPVSESSQKGPVKPRFATRTRRRNGF